MLTFAESDESKIARQKLHIKQNSHDFDNDIIDNNGACDFATIKLDSKFQTLPYNSNKLGLTKSASSGAISYSSAAIHKNRSSSGGGSNDGSDCERATDSDGSSMTKLNASCKNGHQQQQQQLTVHSTPLSTINKSVAVGISTTATTTVTATTITTTTTTKNLHTSHDDKPIIKPKVKQQLPYGSNLVVPPRKPISSVAPTTITMAPKIVAHSPKVHVVAPNMNTGSIVSHMESDKLRPALPPKPAKNYDASSTDNSNSSSSASSTINSSSVPTVVSVINKPPMSEPFSSSAMPSSTTIISNSMDNLSSPPAFSPNTDNLPIKAKPLTIKKQPLSEQPRLRSMNVGIKPIQYNSRRIEMPPAFLFPEIEKGSLMDKSGSHSPNSNSTVDETDKSIASSCGDGDSAVRSNVDVVKRTRSSMNDHGKTKLARRVSFDPLALLLDASLEGELELVRKTTMQVRC